MPEVHVWNRRTINNQWRYNVLGGEVGGRLNTRAFIAANAGSVAIIQLHRKLLASVCARLYPSRGQGRMCLRVKPLRSDIFGFGCSENLQLPTVL